MFGTLLFMCAWSDCHVVSANYYTPIIVSSRYPAIAKVKLAGARPFLKSTRLMKQLVCGALGNSFPDDDKGFLLIGSKETGNSLDIIDSKISKLESEITEVRSLIAAEEKSLLGIQNNGDFTQQFRKDEVEGRIARLVDELNRLDLRLDSLERMKLLLVNQQNLQLQNRNLQLAGTKFKLQAGILISWNSGNIYGFFRCSELGTR